MNSIIAFLKDSSILSSVRYYGTQDLATNWEVGQILSNPDFFSSFYETYPLSSICTIDDFALYLLTLKFSAMREIIPLLVDSENSQPLTHLCDTADLVLQTISPGDAIKFINRSFSEVFSDHSLPADIRYVAFDFVVKYSSGISTKALSFLCTNCGHLVIDHFQDLQKRFEKEPALFDMLYPTGSLHEIDVDINRLPETLDIWSSIITRKNAALQSAVNARIPTLFNDIKNLAESASLDNVLHIEITISRFYDFLRKIRSPLANIFSKYYLDVQHLLEQHITERGHCFEYEIPVGDILKEWSSIDHPLFRLLRLTHGLQVEGSKVICKSSLSLSTPPRQLVDLVGSNLPRDDFFTSSHQSQLKVCASIRSATMLGLITSPDLSPKYYSLLLSAVKCIEEQLAGEIYHLVDDAELLVNALAIATANSNAEDTALRALCYSPSMLLCALTEKLLRITYLHIISDIEYVPISRATLGELLSEDNQKMVDLFGKDHIKNLAFFFLQVGEKKDWSQF